MSGQMTGAAATTNMNCSGKIIVPAKCEIVPHPSSRGDDPNTSCKKTMTKTMTTTKTLRKTNRINF
jgi:hypothetical protein